MEGAPIASYTGDIAGLPATKSDKGKKVDTRSAAATVYRNHLEAQHSDVLGRAGLSSRPTVYDYNVTLNGVALKLTAAEATRLQHTSGVLNVWKSEIYKTDTVSTPAFLGLDGSSGVWPFTSTRSWLRIRPPR